MTPIDATAQAIYIFEGGAHPNSLNVRSLNPGNLREVGATSGYRVFTSFAAGWQALVEDIQYKLDHHLTPTSTMVDFFNLYAPGADHNDPHGYAQFVCGWLTTALSKPVTIATAIGDIYV